jgi:WD40 repeat protein
MAHFNRDGNRILSASRDHTARLWDVALSGCCPDWFARLAEGICGAFLDNDNVMKPLSNGDEIIRGVRTKLAEPPRREKTWFIWGQQFLAASVDENQRSDETKS